MDGVGMVLVYVGGAALLALIANRMPWLRRQIGWHDMGEGVQVTSENEALANVVANIGTGTGPEEGRNWRIHRSSLGVKPLTAGLTLAIAYYMVVPPNEGMSVAPTPPAMLAAIGLACVWGNLYVWRFRVATNGSVLRVHGVLGSPKRYALANLRAVEEDKVHSFRLTFADGRAVEILKSVAGARDLRQLLEETLERNQRA